MTSYSARAIDTDVRKKSENQVKTCKNITEKNKPSDEAVGQFKLRKGLLLKDTGTQIQTPAQTRLFGNGKQNKEDGFPFQNQKTKKYKMLLRKIERGLFL